jgi:iron(III) transport system substrate-binding protein
VPAKAGGHSPAFHLRPPFACVGEPCQQYSIGLRLSAFVRVDAGRRKPSMCGTFRSRARAVLAGLLALSALALADSGNVAAQAPAPAWADQDLVRAARAEGGSLTVYSSVNEQEALPFWKLFEDATGIKVEYVRASDVVLIGRIAIEARARQRSWDLLLSPAVGRLPRDFMQPIDLSEAKNLIPQARDPDRRWYGVYANYDVPSYNSKLVNQSDLPASYEDFLKHKEWAGRIAVEQTDVQWLSALFTYYGEERARKLIGDIVATLKPVVIDGHLALARAVAAGEYAVTMNNYLNLTVNMRLTGAPTDYWGLDPVAVFFGSVAVSPMAPHPRTAALAANFVLSREAQHKLTTAGRLPVRTDVMPNPPDAITKLGQRKVIVVDFPGEEEKKWQRTFQDLFRPR